MPSFEDKKRQFSNVGTHGQQLKVMADMVVQETFDNSIETRLCYLYDYYHDDQFEEGLSDYNPSLSQSKIPVNLKFIFKSNKTISKDDPEHHIMFEPNVWNSMSCKPQWFVDGYQKFGIKFPVGLYVDIPDDRGVYNKWLVVYNEVSNQFPKFGVLRCNYLFTWIKDDGIHRYKRKMWGVEKTQSSYTAGTWSGDKTTVFDEVGTWWLPWNSINSEIRHDQRFFVSMIQDEPYVYKVSKIKNTSPKGIINVTAKQDRFDKNKDYVDNNPNSPTYGEMYADYYSSSITPEEEPVRSEFEIDENILSIEAKTYSVRIGGSKIVNAIILDKDNNDVTNNYNSSDLIWSFSFKDDGFVASSILSVDKSYSLKEGNEYKCKFKFLGDEAYLNQKITVKVTINNLSASADLDIVS